MTKAITNTTPKPKRARVEHKDRARPPAEAGGSTTKLDELTALLLRKEGATLVDMIAATGWQAHSVRGALAGGLKKRGLRISSAKVDGVRVYLGTMEAADPATEAQV